MGWLQNPSRTTWKPWLKQVETIVGWHLQGNHHCRVYEVVQDFVHPQYEFNRTRHHDAMMSSSGAKKAISINSDSGPSCPDLDLAKWKVAQRVCVCVIWVPTHTHNSLESGQSQAGVLLRSGPYPVFQRTRTIQSPDCRFPQATHATCQTGIPVPADLQNPAVGR